ncbi:hypothetical protein H0H87_008827 [Tephrocybe sp. NHM501043]|nr:hypothetical protein H0H87_008827 [Tephrocybe sp. NHM501043]
MLSFSDIQAATDFSMPNIAERAKMRSRITKSQVQQAIVPTSDIIELSSDDDDDFEIVPASRRRKSADKAKGKLTKKRKSNFGPVHAEPDPKPRPRPRPLKKSLLGKSSDPMSPFAAITQDIYPPTSSISNSNYPIPFKLLPSQLPPSDPPSSTATTHGVPPIETLHMPSSPASLSSSGKKKRKRSSSHVDELDSDPDPLAGGAMDVDTLLMPPPPHPGPPSTFFVGSSSPMPDDRPPAMSSTITKTPAVKKPRKKKNADGPDGDDGAWGTSKPTTKQRSKKTPVQKLEVVIEQPAKSLIKEKGKEREVFKSREFIDDDDDNDPLNQVTPCITSSVSKTPESLTSSTFVHEPDMDEPAVAGPSRERKSIDWEDDELDAIGRKDVPARSRKLKTTKGKRQMVINSDEDDSADITELPSPKATGKAKGNVKAAKARATPAPVESDDVESSNQSVDKEKEPQSSASYKENAKPPPAPSIPQTPKPATGPGESLFPSLSSLYTIAPKTKSTPMSDLIRRVNSKPGSPFVSPAPRSGGARPATPGTAYSPYVKASRSALSRIAPLHPNRRTPPPPLPPPPPKKKTKKELEREEQWEEELVESVGGITEWACMSDAERKEMRKAKREREMYGWED